MAVKGLDNYVFYRWGGRRAKMLRNRRGNRTAILETGTVIGIRFARSESHCIRVVVPDQQPLSCVFSMDFADAVKILYQSSLAKGYTRK